MGLMSAVKSIFIRPKTVDDFLDSEKGHIAKIGQFIGNQQFTDQERAKMMEGLTHAVRQFSVDTAKESTSRSVTRRNLAVMWIKVQLGLVIATFIAGIFGYEQFDLMWQIVTSDVMTFGTAGVMIYFFGAYGFGAYIGKK